MKKELSSLLSLVCVFSLGVVGMACGADALAEGFADPPAESRPTSKIRSDLILEVFRKLTANLSGSAFFVL